MNWTSHTNVWCGLSFFTDFDPVNREMFTVFDRDCQGL